MSREIFQSHIVSDALYALVRRPSDGYIWVPSIGTPAFEALGTWNDARVQACAIAMTPSGDFHYADFPILITEDDAYQVQVRVASGGAGSEAILDWIKSQGQISWSGDTSEEITLGYLGDAALFVTEVVPLPESVETRARIYI